MYPKLESMAPSHYAIAEVCLKVKYVCTQVKSNET